MIQRWRIPIPGTGKPLVTDESLIRPPGSRYRPTSTSRTDRQTDRRLASIPSSA